LAKSTRLESLLIVSDAHRPFHDERAWNLVMSVGQWLRPHHVTIIGDFVDFYAVSSHSKDPGRKERLTDEIDSGNAGLDELDRLNPAHKRYIAGNHEDRFTRYIQDKAPELFGMTDIPALLNLKARGWKYTPYKHHTEIGQVNYTHDVGYAGRNAAFRVLDTYQHSAVTGHTHRLQYIVEGNALGESKLSAMFGWLGDVNKVDYMHRAKVNKDWALGFGVGYVNPADGINYLVPVPIIKSGGRYTCVVNGTYFSG
jgi:hypothetical protein